jgi:hypothetical protein
MVYSRRLWSTEQGESGVFLMKKIEAKNLAAQSLEGLDNSSSNSGLKL